MTEAEWLACTDPMRMLEHLRGKSSARKLRLFAVACCRRIWPLLTDARSRCAVEVGERHADGQASEQELEVSQSEARAAIPNRHPAKGMTVGTRAWREARVAHALTGAAWATILNSPYAVSVAQQTGWVAQQRGLAWSGGGGNWQCDLLRDIFGNPSCTMTFNPDWLTPAINSFAQVIYEDRRFEDLPILADALEEAGCTNAQILDHFRGPGPHVRGCGALDLLLGKQ